ncbi:MAG: hypothetical protein KDN20_26000 [Verrucomicrobiae bacterium]|nr:hypothetical protein [Verrucomicrobiae bacterium]
MAWSRISEIGFSPLLPRCSRHRSSAFSEAEVLFQRGPRVIAKFGRMMIAVIELEREVELKDLEIKINQGTENPGLSAIEVY